MAAIIGNKSSPNIIVLFLKFKCISSFSSIKSVPITKPPGHALSSEIKNGHLIFDSPITTVAIAEPKNEIGVEFAAQAKGTSPGLIFNPHFIATDFPQ
ncbi:unnamed protein product [Meloidogyne enterolobii]|uniref:Uncharacterized protein n=1 Tax=Meloidogyne enterolobii TaxID=390850 RepID=A0ACB0ZS58_MELEN